MLAARGAVVRTQPLEDIVTLVDARGSFYGDPFAYAARKSDARIMADVLHLDQRLPRGDPERVADDGCEDDRHVRTSIGMKRHERAGAVLSDVVQCCCDVHMSRVVEQLPGMIPRMVDS